MVVGERKHNQSAGTVKAYRFRLFLCWMILVIGTILSVVAFRSVRAWERGYLHTDFDVLSASHAAAVANELNRHLDVTNVLAGLFDVSQRVDRLQFDMFAKTLLESHKDIQALMWAPRVGAAERAAFEGRAAQLGLANFRIRDLSGGDAPAAVSTTDYFPVYYLQPLQPNEDLLGADLMADDNTRDFLEKARDTGQLTVSPPVHLNLQVGDSMGNGVLLARAIYQQGANLETVAGRRAGLEGFVLQLLRMGDLIEEGLRESAVLGLNISVVYDWDPDDGRERHYFHSSASSNDHGIQISQSHATDAIAGLRLRTPLDALGKEWGLLFTPAPRFWLNHPMWMSWVVLGSGMLISALLAVGLLMWSRLALRI
jgi:CHASE1-domain containing sensor protein